MCISVAFDLDDTLYKEEDFVKSGYKAVAETIGDEKAYSVMIDAYKKGENPFNAVLDNISTEMSDKDMLTIYRQHIPNITLDEETKNTLQALKDSGFHLSLITDGRTLTQRNKIKSLGLTEFFGENIYISEEQGADKMLPNSFIAVEKKFSSDNAFWYIGDNLKKDFLHPNKMGWKTVCLRDRGNNVHPQNIIVEDEYRPQIYINSIDELLRIITNKNHIL